MRCPSKCDLCEHETKQRLYEVGPETFGKTKTRWVCKNYECNAFSEYHLYPGDKIPEKEETVEEMGVGIPDLVFTPEDEQPLFEGESDSAEVSDASETKKTTAKKSTGKKGVKK